MAVISFQKVQKRYGADLVLDDISFALGAGDKAGLVGPNGSGKTTILRLIVGGETPDSGSINILPGIGIGFLQQDSELTGTGPLLEEVTAASGKVKDIEVELRRLEERIAQAPEDLDALVERYGEAQLEYERLGGYSFEAEVKAALTGLGLGPEHWDKPVSVLSGGQKTRAALAKLLVQKPDVLLLDEPTNHLDIHACQWLEEYLASFHGSVLVVSHDRYFLDRVAGKIVDLHNGRTSMFHGNYSAYARQKKERLEEELIAYNRQLEQIEKMEEYIRRFRAGQRAAQAKGRKRHLDRMKRLERPNASSDTLSLALQERRASGKLVYRTDGLGKWYGEQKLFSGLDLILERGERVGLVGPNGSGKTTLMKIILGLEPPTRGIVEEGFAVEPAYFSQDMAELDPQNLVIEELMETADITVSEARDLLARFLFRGDDVFKPVQALSGGERNRLMLACLMVEKPNVLALDEPTNHLDIDSREALGEALKSYNGTILLTSHDRYLLASLVTRVVEISGGEARVFPGGYEEYLRQARPPASSQPKKKKAPTTRVRPNSKKGPKPEVFEARIQEAEGRLEEVNQTLSKPETYADHTLSAQLLEEHGTLERELKELYEQWEQALEAG